jgi:TolB-like protein/Tfp pilus assembly protein PilF
MGEIWLAEDMQLPRRVAVKLLHGHLSTSPEAVDRLLREARAAAQVDHPNVIAVYEAGVHAGQPFLVMPLVEGETLEQRLERGPLPVGETVAMIQAIADALAEVHALGIVHRDLKPANIILAAHGPRVLDFGVAAIGGDSRMTSTGFTPGTPLTMSPEQFRGEPADGRSDLWALGVILYEALTGIRPFEAETLAGISYRVAHEQPAPPSARRPEVPAGIDHIVAKLLRKDPARRYARAEDLVADLAEVGEEIVLPAPRVTPRLAVLPFEALGSDPEDEYLADGLTEDLIVDLSRVEGLRVRGRGEVLRYRGREVPPRTIARELGVDFVLIGSVRRAGTRARISAQLLRATDGQVSWAERFDRTLDDLFEVQTEVSKRIVEALNVALRPGEEEMLDRAPTRNRAAYALFLRGRALADHASRESSRRAVECYRQAVALDPEFALAHAALAECIARGAAAWWLDREMFATARVHAQRALDLDPQLPAAHMAMGWIHRLDGDAAGALAQVEAARKLDSTDPEIMNWVALGYMRLGRPEEAIGILRRAVALHPREYRLLSPYGDCLDMLGLQDELRQVLARLIEVLLDTLAREPDNLIARAMLGTALVQQGQREEGLAQTRHSLAVPSEDGRVRYNAACAFAHAQMPEEAMEQLRVMLRENPGYIPDWLVKDPDLVSLHGRADFNALFEGHRSLSGAAAPGAVSQRTRSEGAS